MSTLSRNIRYLRKLRGFSQDYVAEELGLKSFTTVQKWESGVAEPQFAKAVKLAELFNVTLSDLASRDLSGEDTFSPSEYDLIRTFRSLDEFGQKNVLTILQNEAARCASKQ